VRLRGDGALARAGGLRVHFAVVKAITHWDSLLLGHPFVVETASDHKNLGFLYKSDSPGPKVVRWKTVTPKTYKVL
jgi:hypothetical protein